MLSIRQLSVGLCLLLTTPLVPAQAATPNLCTLFTTQEVKTLLGTEVEAGEPAAMGTGCQWFGKDEQSYAVVQMVGSDYWVDPQQAPGYEPIPKLGKQAYSHPDMEGGWRAMALTADAAVRRMFGLHLIQSGDIEGEWGSHLGEKVNTMNRSRFASVCPSA
jgi:hypothetical protein